MVAVLVDCNVFLDVFTEDATWSEWSSRALEQAADSSRFVINPGIFAELSVHFDTIEGLDAALPPVVQREAIPFEAAFLAGKCFLTYRRRGGAKTSPLPDFFIGAHAAIANYRLLTRDANRYRTYFPKLPLMIPG